MTDVQHRSHHTLPHSTAQAKSALFYLVKYITKNKADLDQVLVILSASLRQVNANPSVADDTGTAQRTAQHFITRTTNGITGMQELADPQAAFMLLGGQAEMMTMQTGFLYVWSAVTHAELVAKEKKALGGEADDPGDDLSLSNWEEEEEEEEDMLDDDGSNRFAPEGVTKSSQPRRAALPSFSRRQRQQ